jgi:hypothetical protein
MRSFAFIKSLSLSLASNIHLSFGATLEGKAEAEKLRSKNKLSPCCKRLRAAVQNSISNLQLSARLNTMKFSFPRHILQCDILGESYSVILLNIEAA